MIVNIEKNNNMFCFNKNEKKDNYFLFTLVLSIFLFLTSCNSFDSIICGDYTFEEIRFLKKLDSIASIYYDVRIEECNREELKITSKNPIINDSVAIVLLDTIDKYKYTHNIFWIEIFNEQGKFEKHLSMVEGKPKFTLDDGN